MPAPMRPASSHIQIDQRARLRRRRVSAGAQSPTTNAVAAPPSPRCRRHWAIALRPTSCGVDQSSPSCTSMSVDTTVRPSPAVSAASSPGPKQYRGGLSAPPHQPITAGARRGCAQRRGLRCKVSDLWLVRATCTSGIVRQPLGLLPFRASATCGRGRSYTVGSAATCVAPTGPTMLNMFPRSVRGRWRAQSSR